MPLIWSLPRPPNPTTAKRISELAPDTSARASSWPFRSADNAGHSPSPAVVSIDVFRNWRRCNLLITASSMWLSLHNPDISAQLSPAGRPQDEDRNDNG